MKTKNAYKYTRALRLLFVAFVILFLCIRIFSSVKQCPRKKERTRRRRRINEIFQVFIYSWKINLIDFEKNYANKCFRKEMLSKVGCAVNIYLTYFLIYFLICLLCIIISFI